MDDLGAHTAVADPSAPTGGDTDPGSGDESSDAPVSAILVTLDDEAHSGREWLNWAGFMIALLCAIGVFWALSPNLILANTTPTGGDMGAHVWGPAYLRSDLLPHLRLTGWTPDWYAGFPAYVFYMVVPSLFIVWLDLGPPLVIGLPLAAAVLGGAWWAKDRLRTPLARIVLAAAAVLVAVALIDIPYNIAFKLVAVSGLVTLPIAAWALGRGAKVAFPIPPLLAIGATFFLFEGGFSILGGNILSTMAGEFAFSISLTFAVLYLAVLLRGIDTGRHRALGAILFALVVLNHLIPAIFAVIATVVIVVVRREDRTPWWDSSRQGRWFGAVLVAQVLVVLWLVPAGFPVVATFTALVMLVGFDARALRWAAVVVPTGGLLAAFWLIPFYLDSAFLNDMGWEKYTNYAKYLWPQHDQFDMANRNLWFALAGAGIVLSLVHRVRLGWILTLTLVAYGWAFVFLPQYRLWNARLLPFYFLCVYLLAALAVALVLRAVGLVAGDLWHRREEPWTVSVVGTVLAALVALVYLAGSLQSLPGGSLGSVKASDGTSVSAYKWGPFNFQDLNNASGWASYNFSGLEAPDKAYPEFRAVIDMMAKVGRTDGCGRTMWEYEPSLSRFGTPMALMLLPYFTHSCIGSMEGLYFEASSTTPFHFINQSELSPSPSRAQRDLPYPAFDMAAGIHHLQLMGVPYYLASTRQAVDAARANPDLSELDSTPQFTQPDGSTRQWVVFKVADSEQIVPLKNLPVVITPEDDHIDGWVFGEHRPPASEQDPNPKKTPGPAMDWYLDPSRWDVPLATSGPDNWPRIARSEADQAPKVPVKDPAVVSDVSEKSQSISFTVDKVGSPVLVKTSYFPNWKASGAEGPYRVTPNFMVVVPTDTHVTLSYGRTGVDYLGWLLTVIGVGLVVFLARRDHRGEGDYPDSGDREPEAEPEVTPDPESEPTHAASVDPPVGSSP